MPSKEEMKKEILDSLRDNSFLLKVNEELDILETTEGLNSKNNLEHFYEIWKKNKDKVGDNNQVNSWTAYSLGMTSKKPSGEFLTKRRAFARPGYPDIDTDFEKSRRDEVKNHVREKYGDDFVSDCGTYGTLKFRSAITRVGKVLDVANAFHKGKDAYKTENQLKIQEILSAIPNKKGLLKATNSKGQEIVVKTLAEAIDCFPGFKYYMEQYPELYKYASNVEGLVSNFGVHASGLFISDIEFSKIAPRRHSTKGFATEYGMNDLESLGLIKFDFLGLTNLTSIKACVKLIEKNVGIKLDLEELPLDDAKTYELYRSGKLTGVFQCENYGMQNVIKEIAPTCFEDISASIALFRPGPMDNIPEYVARRRGKPFDYGHPSIEPFVKPHLEETMGILIYQESLMYVCVSLANFTVFEGYDLIKGVGKKQIDIISKYKVGFIAGCKGNKIPEDVSEMYWERYIIPFANYGFNRSHACAYGLISYYTAYLKANYPEEFFVSCLNVFNEAKKQEKVDEILHDMRNFKMKLGQKSIAMCNTDFSIYKKRDISNQSEYSVISPSLMVKGIGYDSAKEIENNKPYASLKDLATKTSSLVNKETIENLFNEGFFEIFIKDHQKKNRVKLDCGKIVDMFVMYREDEKKRAKKGIVGKDMFED